MLASKENKSITYIQQENEFDYLHTLIDSVEPGSCTGILLYGPPGTGKTLLAISLAKRFNSQYFIIDGSPDLDRRDLEGYWELIQGGTTFNYGPLTQAIQIANEEGISFIIINEINAIRDSEQISLNSLLSENHINLISKGFEKFELNSESKLIIIGTMNKGVIGVSQLQSAFEDRFVVCPEIKYPEKQKEVQIATKITNCKKSLAELVVDAARQIRKQAIEDYSLTKIFSTRLIVNFCYIVSKMPPKYLRENIENIIINKLGENKEERKSIAMILDGKMFEGRLKDILLGREDKKKSPNEDKSINSKEEKTIQEMKKAIKHYLDVYGNDSIIKPKGGILWKSIYWLWKNHKRELQQFFRLTEKYRWNEEYQRRTGKTYIYAGRLTLKYIKWVYSKKNRELGQFLRSKCQFN
ncbi:MAG: Denitrification regulatory protein NirQ [Promethearchaeota archaeon]|nr:MAG: Denitrification regulatory protein NirQ [Candidatus Lokiarchaeota archaeon]